VPGSPSPVEDPWQRPARLRPPAPEPRSGARICRRSRAAEREGQLEFVTVGDRRLRHCGLTGSRWSCVPNAAWNNRRVPNTEPVHVQLNAEERAVLRAGLLDWGGPARPTDALAVAMGFTDAAALPSEAWALWERIDRSSSLTADDWRRVLLAVEVVFVSDVVGSGLDWRFTSGFSDAETIGVVRGLQRKLPRWRGSFQFTRDDAGRVTILDGDRPDS
jgi:hypothetical protein